MKIEEWHCDKQQGRVESAWTTRTAVSTASRGAALVPLALAHVGVHAAVRHLDHLKLVRPVERHYRAALPRLAVVIAVESHGRLQIPHG
jgi:hypothetical protein